MIDEITQVTRELFETRYPDATVIFLAGSLVRGEGTPHSDLDLVVIFESLSAAYRESYHHRGFPVEAFVHDPETLNYFFFEVDRPSGIPSLAQMVLEAVEVPGPNQLSAHLKSLAKSVLDLGPPALTGKDIARMRYSITNLIDDIRDPRSTDELVATGTELYEALADCYLHTNNLWSAKGKSIPRILKQTDSDLSARYRHSFEQLFVSHQPGAVIALALEILTPTGGFLFDGHDLIAPTDWRKPLD